MNPITRSLLLPTLTLASSLAAQSGCKIFDFGADEAKVSFTASGSALGDFSGTSQHAEAKAAAECAFEIFGAFVTLSGAESRCYAAFDSTGKLYSTTRKLVILEETEYSTSGYGLGSVTGASFLSSMVVRERFKELPTVTFTLGPVLAKLKCSVGTSCALQTSFSYGTSTPTAALGGNLEANAGSAEADASISAGVKVLGFEVVWAEFGVRAELDLGHLVVDASLKAAPVGGSARLDYSLAAVHLELYVHATIKVLWWTKEWEEEFFDKCWGVASGAIL